MRKILFIIPNLEFSGAAKQVSLLAAGLSPDRFAVQVCALANPGPAVEKLHAAGVPFHALGGTRLVNLGTLWQLRCLVQTFQPDVIHTWGRWGLRAIALAGRGTSRLYASLPFGPQEKRTPPGRLDRWLLRRVDQVMAQGPAEAERCRHFGLPPEKIRIMPPGVESLGDCRLGGLPMAVRSPGFSRWSGSPPAEAGTTNGHRWVICAGPLEPHKGFRDAIWAFDILQYLYEDVRLLVIGTGSYQDRLKEFAEATGAAQRVHFAGRRSDMSQLLAGAEVVWVPSLADGGVNVTLEAMALGRVVVASRLPGLAEIIAHGQTGLLVTPGSKVELARQTRLLLDNAHLRDQMGEAGRRRAADHFSVADLVRRYSDLYAMKIAA